MRVSQVRVHLRGFKALAAWSLQLSIETIGRFLNIIAPKDDTFLDTRAFVGDSRAVLFEKDLSGAEEQMTCNGDYGLNQDTPYRLRSHTGL